MKLCFYNQKERPEEDAGLLNDEDVHERH